MTDDGPLPRRLAAWTEVFGGLDDAMALLTLLELGVFEALRGGPLVAADLARIAAVESRRLRPMLDLAASVGFLERAADAYRLPPGEAAFHDPEQPWLRRMGASDLRGQLLLRARAVEVLRSGEAAGAAGTGGEVPEAQRRDFLQYLHDASGPVAAEVARRLEERVTLAGASPPARLADLGAGAGTYALAVLERFPEATAVLVDRTNAEPVARDTAAGAGLQGRVDFLAADFLQDDFGAGYDLVLLSNVIHCYGPEDNRRLLGRVRDALRPGGWVAIKDLAVADDRSGPRSALRFGTSMALFSDGGDVWPEAEVRRWCHAAELRFLFAVPLAEDAEEAVLMVAERPTEG